MGEDEKQNQSLIKKFTREYLLVSLIPFCIFLLFSLVGALVARDRIEETIRDSSMQLSTDARLMLEEAGQRGIRQKALDVAMQARIFLLSNPLESMEDLQKNELFGKIAIQKVGKRGYTCMYEAKTGIMRFHPNADLIDRPLHFLSEKLPRWWSIYERSLAGIEVSGYYDWQDADGRTHKKYMAMAPVGIEFNGKTLMIAATAYADEFWEPSRVLEARTEQVVTDYLTYAAAWEKEVLVAGAVLMIAIFAAGIWLGRRSALRYIGPIANLTEAAGKIGIGKWDFAVDSSILERMDEIGVLGRTFDSMRTQLKKSFEDLERRLSELKIAQKELNESEEKYRGLYEESLKAEELYRSLLNSSADAIVIYDLDGKVIYVSHVFTELFGWTLKDLKGKRIPYLPETERAKTTEFIKGVLHDGTPCRGYETKRYTKDSQLVHVSISASRFEDHDGKPAGILVILRDITDRKKLEEQLLLVQRMESIGTLAGGIAHDFNNLMMGILGNVSVIMHDMPPDDPVYPHLKNIDKLIESGTKLTGKLLGYSRRNKFEVGAADLNVIVEESLETFGRARKEIAIHMEKYEGKALVEVDRARIEQVLFNLFVNAADAMPKGGDLFVNITVADRADLLSKPLELTSEKYVLVRVADTGTGMDAETKQRIFDPFFTTKPMGRGTGLGLASVYGIIKAHSGFVEVESEPDKGTAFFIYLPLSGLETAHVPEEKTVVRKGRGKVLLIDDEQMVLEIGAKMLIKIGYDVVVAKNSAEAVSLFKNDWKTIDLVILDMIMPGTTGSETYDALRKINPAVKVLLSSGYGKDWRTDEIMDRGCNGFIQKPYSIEVLSEEIDAVLNNRL